MTERMGGGWQKVPPPLIRSKGEEEIVSKKEKEEDQLDQFPDVMVNGFFVRFMEEYDSQIRNGDIGLVIQDLDSKISELVWKAAAKKNKEYAMVVAREILASLDMYHIVYENVKENKVDFKKDSAAKQGIKNYLINYIESGGEINLE
ncbi:MAG: hypothetical protein ABSF47_02385 [Minisyncoccia bacterium]|jgi:hypothetical protein